MLVGERKTLIDLAPRDYSFYLFEKNPFKAMPVAMRDPDFLTDRDDVFNELKGAIASGLHNKTFEGRLLIADYGMGKSHILKFMRRRINLDLRESTHSQSLAAYTVPGKGMLDLYTGLLKDLGEELLIEISSATSKGVDQELVQGQQYTLWGDVGGKKYYVRGFVKDVWERLTDRDRSLMNKDCFVALSLLRERQYREDALYWLQGGNLAQRTSGEMGISSRITRDTAQEAFVTLVKVTHLAGYEHFFLCLDEMEKFSYLTDRLRSEYFEQLRYIIDQLTTGFSIFGAITPEAERLLFEEERHAFQSRIAQFPKRKLRPMDTSDVKELVREYMYEERERCISESQEITDKIRERLENAGIVLETEEQIDLFPFSPHVIDAIGKHARGNPRDILNFCSQLVELGCDGQRVYYNVDETLSLLGVQLEEAMEE